MHKFMKSFECAEDRATHVYFETGNPNNSHIPENKYKHFGNAQNTSEKIAIIEFVPNVSYFTVNAGLEYISGKVEAIPQIKAKLKRYKS